MQTGKKVKRIVDLDKMEKRPQVLVPPAPVKLQASPVREDVVFSVDVVTTITKLLYERGRLGIAAISDKFLRLEQATPKEIQEKINQFYPKQAKEAAEQVVSHEAFEGLDGLLSRNVLVRRGRNNRIFARLIDKAVFDEDE